MGEIGGVSSRIQESGERQLNCTPDAEPIHHTLYWERELGPGRFVKVEVDVVMELMV